MSTRLVDKAGSFLAAHTSRRGFLRRAALVGSAVVTAPANYLLRPLTAYSAIVGPGDCPNGTACSDGWTEFCCTMTGVNTCPPGSVVAGWWRAEGSGYCGGGSRYYMDCHHADCGGCGCGASGTCSDACVPCDCGCAHDNCHLRKTCCTRFRYGQCNNHLACVGPITCRVVTCVPPWQWDSTCTGADARADSTAFHDAACLHLGRTARVARPAVVGGSSWALRNSLTAGGSESTFSLGVAGDIPFMADWTGSGVATPGIARGARHGRAGQTALTWYLRQTEGPGQPEVIFNYGQPGDIPVVGDWNGDGVSSIGVVRGNQWLLRNSNNTGNPEIVFTFGEPGDIPVVGDWDGDGIDEPGVVRGATWMLRMTASSGAPDLQFDFGDSSGLPVVGDWSGNGVDTPGRYVQGVWNLRDDFQGGPPQRSFSFGEPSGIPVVWGKVV
jgi:hypothetical protein